MKEVVPDSILELLHLNTILRAIRNVNQLIITEKNRTRLIRKTCNLLIESEGFLNGWIVLFDSNGTYLDAAQADLPDQDFKALNKRLKTGMRDFCVQQALKQQGLVSIDDPVNSCGDCPLCHNYGGRGGLAACLRHEGKVYGTLTVSVDQDFIGNIEERNLFIEIARDIAFKLHTIEMEEERTRVEKELHRSEEKFRVLYNNSPDMYVSVLSENASILLCNDTFLKKTGYLREEVIGSPIFKIYHDDCMEEVKKTFQQFVKTGVIEDKELIIKTKNGSKIDISLNVGAIKDETGKILHSISTLRDITGHKLAEQALRENEECYRGVVEDMPMLTCRFLPNGKITFVNKSYCEYFDKTPEELIGSTFLSLIPRSDQETVMANISTLTVKSPTQSQEHQVITPGGNIHWQRWTNRALFDTHGKIISYQSIGEDITDRKQAEAERKLLSTAIEQSAETVVITDVQGNIQYVNPAFEQITGYSREEALGKNPHILKSGKQDEPFYQELWGTISGGRVWHGKMVNRRKGGCLFIEEATISPVFDTSGTISNYVAVKRDITKEQELEQQFLQAQKMESIGTLAGGVAHDFNNMLSVIIGYSELALEKLDPADKLYYDIQAVHKAGQRSMDLTRQLLAFARKQTIAPQVLNLNDAVTNTLKMLRRLIGEDMNLVWMPGANLKTIHIDPAQVDQILTNLCVNARDAIDDTGRIIIKTENVTLDEAYCEAYTHAEPGAYIMLTVSDDGCGMDKEIMCQVFEPFFTTKAQGEGTGLGLATIYGIVKQNNGLVHVYSEPGQGTSFKIHFPCYRGADLVEQAEKEMELPAGHGELIMLVEDETSILELVRSMLESIGYTVIAADTPLKALCLAKEQGDAIKLLITDVVMPEMNGKQLANQLQTFNPEIKVLFMSGYTSNIIAHHGVLDEGVDFISKPFTLPVLAAKLNEVFQP